MLHLPTSSVNEKCDSIKSESYLWRGGDICWGFRAQDVGEGCRRLGAPHALDLVSGHIDKRSGPAVPLSLPAHNFRYSAKTRPPNIGSPLGGADVEAAYLLLTCRRAASCPSQGSSLTETGYSGGRDLSDHLLVLLSTGDVVSAIQRLCFRVEAFGSVITHVSTCITVPMSMSRGSDAQATYFNLT